MLKKRRSWMVVIIQTIMLLISWGKSFDIFGDYILSVLCNDDLVLYGQYFAIGCLVILFLPAIMAKIHNSKVKW